MAIKKKKMTTTTVNAAVLPLEESDESIEVSAPVRKKRSVRRASSGHAMGTRTRSGTGSPPPDTIKVRGLQGTSFKRATSERPKRLILLVTGLTDTGRTYLSLTAPGPIAYMGIEMGDEGVKEQFASKKQIYYSHYVAKTVRKLDQSDQKEKLKSQQEAQNIFTRFTDDYVAALASPDIRTIIWDTGSQFGDLSKVAAFGKLSKIMPRDRVELKYEFNKIVQMAYAYDKNLIVITKLGAVWVDDKATKDLEPKGISEVLYLFPTIVRTWSEREENDDGVEETVHWFEVEKAKGEVHARLVGKVYEAPENELKYLAADMLDIDPDEWK